MNIFHAGGEICDALLACLTEGSVNKNTMLMWFTCGCHQIRNLMAYCQLNWVWFHLCPFLPVPYPFLPSFLPLAFPSLLFPSFPYLPSNFATFSYLPFMSPLSPLKLHDYGVIIICHHHCKFHDGNDFLLAHIEYDITIIRHFTDICYSKLTFSETLYRSDSMASIR